jgi:hypothetical protein
MRLSPLFDLRNCTLGSGSFQCSKCGNPCKYGTYNAEKLGKTCPVGRKTRGFSGSLLHYCSYSNTPHCPLHPCPFSARMQRTRRGLFCPAKAPGASPFLRLCASPVVRYDGVRFFTCVAAKGWGRGALGGRQAYRVKARGSPLWLSRRL